MQAQYQAGGIEALKNEVALEGKSAREDLLFVRVVGPQNTTVFLNAPEHWKDLDLRQLESISRNRNEQPIYLQTRNGYLCGVKEDLEKCLDRRCFSRRSVLREPCDELVL